MGISSLISMTVFYIVKYIVYIAIIGCAIFAGKAWADKSAKKKSLAEEEQENNA